jgi:integrase
MSADKPKYVETFHDRHGKKRIYFRKPGQKRIAIPGPLWSDAFQIAYAEALGGSVIIGAEKKKPDAGTIGALILSYQQSDGYYDLRPTTKTGYQSRLKILTEQHGHRSLSGLTIERIEEKILCPYRDKPGQKLALLKMLRVLIRHAIKKKWLTHDPSQGIKRPKSGRVRAWTEAEIAQFEARWPIGTRERLAFSLMLYTGQRRSDAHRMTWADTTLRTMRVIQQKTGAKLTLPLDKRLRAVLDAAPREHVTILNTAFGKPFTVDGFSQYLRDAITAAGLPLECQPHGLRSAAGRRLAEAGCSAKEIMAVLGHKTMSEAQRYIEDADQERLAESAILRLELGLIGTKAD